MCVTARQEKKKERQKEKTGGTTKIRQKMSQSQRNSTGDGEKEENIYPVQILTKFNHQQRTGVC